MKFVISRTVDENFDDVIKFTGEVKSHDLVSLRLNSLDKALLNTINSAHPGAVSAADYLLLLEILFRRHQEQLTLSSGLV